jgi:uncharacterized protein YdeI (BOF family)
MIKRIFGLILTSSLISAGLLFLGTTVMGKFSPVLASSLNPLVAGTNVQTSTNLIQVEKKVPLKAEYIVPFEKSVVISVDNAAPATAPISSQPLSGSSVSITDPVPTATITIAELINSPDQFIHKVFTIAGIATALGSDKFLLNDGTGQILVEVDDNLVKYNISDGQSIIVTGEFDDSDNQNGFEIDASILADANGTIIVHDDNYDDDVNDDCNDDCIDDCSDDDTDDCNDDCIDDSSDDDTDDISDDSSDDDENESSEDNNSDDDNND